METANAAKFRGLRGAGEDLQSGAPLDFYANSERNRRVRKACDRNVTIRSWFGGPFFSPGRMQDPMGKGKVKPYFALPMHDCIDLIHRRRGHPISIQELNLDQRPRQLYQDSGTLNGNTEMDNDDSYKEKGCKK